MENTTKEQIVELLRKEVAKTSGNKTAIKLNISSATISNMLAGKWEKISDDLFRSVEKQLATDGEWVWVETPEAALFRKFLNDASAHSNVFGICANAGFGKTDIGTKQIDKPNDFAIRCNEYFTRKTFLAELLRQMGKNPSGYTIGEMVQTITDHINGLEKPSIRFDEADKLPDQVLLFFISFYNILEDKCGIVLMATDHLRKRIKKGVEQGRKGFAEIYSRLGRRFIEMPNYSTKSIKMIINANGVTDPVAVNAICADADGDVRRVKRLIHAYRINPTMYDKLRKEAA